jgi:hypothetical protein
LGLIITGKAGSTVKVISRMELLVKAPSVTVKVTAELPAAVDVPEISPVTALILNPGGRPLALTRAAGVPPVVYTWNLNGCPTLPVTAVLLPITGPEGGTACTVIVSVALVVPPEFVALSPAWNVPAVVGVPVIALRLVLNVKPGARLLAAREVAPVASN